MNSTKIISYMLCPGVFCQLGLNGLPVFPVARKGISYMQTCMYFDCLPLAITE
jgi:hypothetical protein